MQIGRAYAFNFKVGEFGLRSSTNNQINNSINNLMSRPLDIIEISDKARTMYLDSIKKDNPDSNLSFTFNNTNMKIDRQVERERLENRDFKKTFIDMTVKHRDDIQKIESSDLSEEEKAKKIESAKKIFAREMDTTINEITDQFDDFFDDGFKRLKQYSSNKLEDLFDEEEFKSNLKDKVIELRDMIINSPNSKNTDQIYNSLTNREGETSKLEDMNFQDMKDLNKYIYGPKSENELGDLSGLAAGTKFAMEENDKNDFIEKLGISDVIKEAMYEVNERISVGLMRESAYEEETLKLKESIRNLKGKMEALMIKIEKMDVYQEDLGEEYGVTSKNKMLMSSLKNQYDVMSEYSNVKFRSDNEKYKLFDLSTSKHKITGFDSYRRMKAYYDESKEVKDDEEEEMDNKYGELKKY